MVEGIHDYLAERFPEKPVTDTDKFRKMAEALRPAECDVAETVLWELWQRDMDREDLSRQKIAGADAATLFRPGFLKDVSTWVITAALKYTGRPDARVEDYQRMDPPLGLVGKVKSLLAMEPPMSKPLGGKHFASVLRANEYLDIPLLDQLRIVRRHHAFLNRALQKAEADLSPKTRKQVKLRRMDGNQMLRRLRQVEQESLRFVKERELMTVAPLHERPSAVCLMGPRAQKLARASYYTFMDLVTINPAVTFSKPLLDTVAIHENMPGHRFQLKSMATEGYLKDIPPETVYAMMALTSRSRFATEGWARYAEKLMHDEGFLPSPERAYTDLMMMKEAALITWLEVGVQGRMISPDEALKTYFEQNGSFPARANHIVAGLTKGMAGSYFWGLAQMLQLRRQVEATQGDKFNLKAFNDKVLGLGGLPIPMMARMAFGQTLKPLQEVKTSAELAALYRMDAPRPRMSRDVSVKPTGAW